MVLINGNSIGLLVCPTSSGGHIEHAFQLAQSISIEGQIDCLLLTRRGARAYLDYSDGNVKLLEILPSLVQKKHSPAVTLGKKIISWVIEYYLVVKMISVKKPDFILIEELRYPFISGFKGKSKLFVFWHNVLSHERAGLRRSFERIFNLTTLSGVDCVLVHGTTQRNLASLSISNEVVSVPLPQASLATKPQPIKIDGLSSYALCIGEIRRNKGLELAIAAAEIAKVNLLIAGSPIDEKYFRELTLAATGSKYVTFMAQFLSKEKFISLIASAKVVVLPYTHFDAQSGVIPTAANFGVKIICSDLPSLVEQLSDYPNSMTFRAHDAEGLAALLGQEAIQTKKNNFSNTTWSEVANTILRKLRD